MIPTGPWPTTLNAAQVKEAQAAITAYRGYYAFLSQALAAPGKSWTVEAAKWSADPVKSNDLKYFTDTAKLAQHTTGTPLIYPRVTKVQPALVTLTTCVDTTNVGFFDKSGNSIKAPNQSGSYWRYRSQVQVAQYEVKDSSHSWLVTFVTDDYTKSC